MGDALQQDFCISVLAHKPTIDQYVISRSSDEALVFYLVLKAGTIYEIFNERRAPIGAAGCRLGVLHE